MKHLTTKEIFRRYNEETSVLEDENNEAVIIYGSRATNTNNEDSDLDIFVITKHKKNNIRTSKIIDGIVVETIFITMQSLKREITDAFFGDNSYYLSIFQTGIAVKNQKLVDYYRRLTMSLKNKMSHMIKTNLSEKEQAKLSYYLENFINSKGNKKQMFYYLILFEVQKSYHSMYHYSDINYLKMYELYTNQSKARDIYMLDLPPEGICVIFLRCCEYDKNSDLKLRELFSLINYNPVENNTVYNSLSVYTLTDSSDIKRVLLLLYKQVIKVEQMLMSFHPLANYSYYILLNEFRDKYILLYGQLSLKFESMFEKAIDTIDNNDRIQILEIIFHEIEKNYSFDYDDYEIEYKAL